jgi:hypothetical protein
VAATDSALQRGQKLLLLPELLLLLLLFQCTLHDLQYGTVLSHLVEKFQLL